MPGPLDGIRIVDFSVALTGPLAAGMLVDQGADCIKVEQSPNGDLVRWLGTSLEGISSMFQIANRGKRSAAIDLQQAEGRAIALDLVADADVVVQNFRPGVAERLGIAYADVAAVVPDVVYADITGFGLLGHLGRAAQESGVDAEIDVGAVPLLEGARGLAEAGSMPGGSRRNLAWVDERLDHGGHAEIDVLLLADAQTSGGLVFGAAPAAAHEALDRLGESGHTASVIGRLVEGDGRIRLA